MSGEIVSKTNKLTESLFSQVLDRLAVIGKDSAEIAKGFAIQYAETDNKADRDQYRLWVRRAENLGADIAHAILQDPLISDDLKGRIIREYPDLKADEQPKPQQQTQQQKPAVVQQPAQKPQQPAQQVQNLQVTPVVNRTPGTVQQPVQQPAKAPVQQPKPIVGIGGPAVPGPFEEPTSPFGDGGVQP